MAAEAVRSLHHLTSHVIDLETFRTPESHGRTPKMSGPGAEHRSAAETSGGEGSKNFMKVLSIIILQVLALLACNICRQLFRSQGKPCLARIVHKRRDKCQLH